MEDKEDLESLFKDTNATFQTPNLVTFPNSGGEVVSKPQPEVTGPKTKAKRKRAPAKKRERKEKKAKPYTPSVLSQYADYLDPPIMSDFIVPDSVPVPQQTEPLPPPVEQKDLVQERALKKKRESLRFFVFRNMKDQGKGDNDIKAELKKVETMSEDDIDFELQKVTYSQSEHFSEKVAQLVRDGAGWLAEKLLKGDGKIQAEVEADQALKDALHKELMTKVGLIGTKSQIL